MPQVYFPGGDGWLYAFHARTGQLIWKCDLNPKQSKWEILGRGTRNNVLAQPTVYEDSVIIAVGQNPEHGEGEGHLWRIDATGSGDVSAELGQIGKKGRKNPNSGIIWHYGGGKTENDYVFRRSMSSPAITPDGLLFITDFSGFVYCLDVETGKRYWEYGLLSSVWGSPVLYRGRVLIGDEDGKLRVFAATSFENAPMEFDAVKHLPIYASVHIEGDSIYATSLDRLTKFDFSKLPTHEK